MTGSYKGLQGVTSGDKGLQKLQGVRMDDTEFQGLQGVTSDYRGFEGMTELQRTTGGDKTF